MTSRGGFSDKFGFIAAAAGSAVGLGSIWKFPFEVGNNGGAAFVLVYILCCFVLCFPVMVAEVAIGRKTQKNAVGAFDVLGFKSWRIIGVLGIISGVIILSFYNVVSGWAFGYFIEILKGNFEIGNHFSEFTADITYNSFYSLFFMFMTAYIVSRGVSAGIEKATKIMMPALFIMLISLAAYALTLDYAWEGVKFYLIPDFSKITMPVIYSALGQAFFSLSLGMGALITYGSYVSKENNIIESPVIIILATVGVALIAGLMMFPFVAYNSSGDMTNIPSGPSLIFVTLPKVFESFGAILGIVVGGFFFLLLSFAALTSTVSLLEVPVAYIVDEYKTNRTATVWVTAMLIFLVGIPSMLSAGASDFFTNFITYPNASKATDFLSFVDDVANDTFLPLGGFLISVFTAYFWKKHNLSAEISSGNSSYAGSWVETLLNFAISYICPTILGILFVLTVLNRFFGIVI